MLLGMPASTLRSPTLRSVERAYSKYSTALFLPPREAYLNFALDELGEQLAGDVERGPLSDLLVSLIEQRGMGSTEPIRVDLWSVGASIAMTTELAERLVTSNSQAASSQPGRVPLRVLSPPPRSAWRGEPFDEGPPPHREEGQLVRASPQRDHREACAYEPSFLNPFLRLAAIITPAASGFRTRGPGYLPTTIGSANRLGKASEFLPLRVAQSSARDTLVRLLGSPHPGPEGRLRQIQILGHLAH